MDSHTPTLPSDEQVAAWLEGQDFGPQGPEDWFSEGDQVIVHHPFSRKVLARGKVTDFVDGWYDFGSPESGPGPVEEVTLLVVTKIDGTEIKAYPGDVEHAETEDLL